MPFTIAGIGEVLWDLFPSAKRIGGAPANFCYHAQALGNVAYLVSAVGNDDAGEQILLKLKQSGVSAQYITKDKLHPTGAVSVLIDDCGVPDYTIHQEVAWDYIGLNKDIIGLAGKCDAVCFGTLAQRTVESCQSIRTFVQNVKEGAAIVCDINLRGEYYSLSVIENSLRLCSILKINDEELEILSKLLQLKGSLRERLSFLSAKYDLQLIAVTRGENGSALYTENQFSVHPGFKVKVVDTVGAGDAFTAALVYGVLDGYSLSQINEFANRTASVVCGAQGATGSPFDISGV